MSRFVRWLLRSYAALGFIGYATGEPRCFIENFVVGDDQNSEIRGFRAGDLDGDGDNDIVVSITDNQSSVQDGHFCFENTRLWPTWRIHPIAIGFSSDVMRIEDMDMDGHKDIVSADPGFDVILNDGNMTYSRMQIGSGWGVHIPVLIADFDKNGRADIVHGTSYAIQWYRASDPQSTLAYTLNWIEYNANAYDTAVADVDGDGYLDIVAFVDSEADCGLCLAWYRYNSTANDHEGGFDQATLIANTTSAWSSPLACFKIAVGDIDGDGNVDVLCQTTHFRGGNFGRIFYYKSSNNGSEWTEIIVYHSTRAWTNNLELVDIDNDGDLDIVVSGRDYFALSWIENTDNTGTTWVRHELPLPEGFHLPYDYTSPSLQMAHMDGDEFIDFVVRIQGNPSGELDINRLVWYRNVACPSTPLPTSIPTLFPTNAPTPVPTESPTPTPTGNPSPEPTYVPTDSPTQQPTAIPTQNPTETPTNTPTDVPTPLGTNVPTPPPTGVPTPSPTDVPTPVSTPAPTSAECGNVTLNTYGIPDRSFMQIFSTQGDYGYQQCCEECAHRPQCDWFSFFDPAGGGNRSALSQCLMFDDSPEAGVRSGNALGWTSASKIYPHDTATAGAEGGVFAPLVSNIALTSCIASAAAIVVTLYARSRSKEAAFKRNLKRRLREGTVTRSFVVELIAAETEMDESKAHITSSDSIESLSREVDALAARHASIPLIGLALVDFIVDWAFVVERFRDPEVDLSKAIAYVPLFSVVFLLVPMLIFLAFTVNLLRTEFRVMSMRKWFFRHSIVGCVGVLLSLGNPEVLTIFTSRTFGCHERGTLFRAPFSVRVRQHLHYAGLIGNILEDFPQIILQVIVLNQTGFDTITIIALLTSGLMLAFGVVRRCLFKLLYDEQRHDLTWHAKSVISRSADPRAAAIAEMARMNGGGGGPEMPHRAQGDGPEMSDRAQGAGLDIPHREEVQIVDPATTFPSASPAAPLPSPVPTMPSTDTQRANTMEEFEERDSPVSARASGPESSDDVPKIV